MNKNEIAKPVIKLLLKNNIKIEFAYNKTIFFLLNYILLKIVNLVSVYFISCLKTKAVAVLFLKNLDTKKYFFLIIF